MSQSTTEYAIEGDNSIYAQATARLSPSSPAPAPKHQHRPVRRLHPGLRRQHPAHPGNQDLVRPGHPTTPGYRSFPHHHGEAETGGYVLRGHGRIYFGENYSEFIDMKAGDWVFVPPFMPHVEANMSVTEELVWLTARTPENLVVNLDDVADETLADYRRVA